MTVEMVRRRQLHEIQPAGPRAYSSWAEELAGPLERGPGDLGQALAGRCPTPGDACVQHAGRPGPQRFHRARVDVDEVGDGAARRDALDRDGRGRPRCRRAAP
ncbi:MAG: hypothetical protein MZW92_71230 [Comamonadaceae bacterium]|nr:hypothetical protein [Comamonadaceae bacterium]